MQEGDVVIVPFPQSDGTAKNRPAVILRELPPFGDFLVCGLSTQLHQRVEGFDELISPGDADFGRSGIKGKSLIRLGYLLSLPEARIYGRAGSISEERHKRLLSALSEYLALNAR